MNIPKRLLFITTTGVLFSLNVLAGPQPGYNQGASLPAQFDVVIDATEYGVVANDGVDDVPAIQAIIDGLVDSTTTLTAIKLPAGVVDFNQELHIDKSGVVIVGAGNDPQSGTQVVVNPWTPYGVDAENAPDFDKKYWPGFAAFRVETRIKHPNEPAYEGSINFHWKHSINFAEPAKQGDTSVKLSARKASEFSTGDIIYVGAATDDLFLDMAQVPLYRRSASHIETGHMRTQLFRVLAVDVATDTVVLDRPLEFDVPLSNEHNYKSRAMPVTAVSNFGIQELYLTMKPQGSACEGHNSDEYSESNPMGVLYRYENVCAENAIHGIVMKWVNNGWVDNVNIEMIGSHPIVTEFAKDITISNNQINGSWNKGAGGNGYLRGSKLYDSWIHHNDIRNIRHLALQWSATGNIVENNYLNMDLNLHGGWERNNLIRNNTIEVPFEHRNWANGSPEPGSTWQPIWIGSGDHASKWSGPTGPNNVFVNNIMKKAESEGASVSPWGLFDEPGVEYAFNWDGIRFKHLNDGGEPVPTWDQGIAEGVYAQIPDSGVSVAGGSWLRPMTTPVEPDEPIEPPIPDSCSNVLNYVWKTYNELVLDREDCIVIDRDLTGKTIQVWDSDENPSCDFRGNVKSIDGSGVLNVASNYVSSKSFTGSVIKFESDNNCGFVKFRAY
ncbi:right-handed parallel beta-helix repeat-containing protein [Aliagarivorans taiwanensis]|uniref:right-handed parallel beta-helix repeat-containing protein n=1 Tax=Aliagarivorans taiwanensis TaxID=561966 RepID=UPI000417642C|nr:right-handed parallel beta-helix repeat-containing protein [Aliagarivorans taiwanensis]